MLEKDELEIDLKEILFALKRNLVLVVTLILAAAIIGAGYTYFLIPEKYVSSATMVVNTRQDQNAVVTNDQINSARQLVETYEVILKSDTVLESVIENLSLKSIQGWENISAAALAKNILTVEQVGNTQVIKISAKTTNANLSANIVSQVVSIAPQIIIDTVKAGSVEVISEPKPNYNKVSPSLSKNTAISALVGLLIGVVVVVIKTINDNTFKTDEDITRHLNLTVLGVIPTINGKGKY